MSYFFLALRCDGEVNLGRKRQMRIIKEGPPILICHLLQFLNTLLNADASNLWVMIKITRRKVIRHRLMSLKPAVSGQLGASALALCVPSHISGPPGGLPV